MIQVHDLDGTGEVLIGQIPNPDCAVANDNFLLCTGPAPLPCFGVNAQAEMVRAFDGRDIACRVRVTRGPALLICGGCVNTQPTLTSRVCAGWPSTLPARPSA